MSKFLKGVMKKFSPTFKTNDEGEEETIVIPVDKAGKEFVQVGNRIFFMPSPSEEKMLQIATYLNTKFGNNYLIYNVSEHHYNTEPFKNQVIDYVFPGYPCAALDALFIMCKEIETFLETDPRHVAFVHCQASKSRSIMLLAALLTVQSPEYYHPEEALNSICNVLEIDADSILFPSQKRYLGYMGHILNGFVPRYAPLVLERVVINGIPDMESYFSPKERVSEGARVMSCKPYIQLFRNGKFSYSSLDHQLQPLFEADLSYSFKVGQKVENDVLIRCRHYHDLDTRISMFRVFFHTSFVTNNYLRVGKHQIDGAKDNDKFPNTFFVDFIFSDWEGERDPEENKDPLWESIHRKCQERIDQKKVATLEEVDEEEGDPEIKDPLDPDYPVAPEAEFKITDDEEEETTTPGEFVESGEKTQEEEKKHNLEEEKTATVDKKFSTPEKKKDSGQEEVIPASSGKEEDESEDEEDDESDEDYDKYLEDLES